MTIDRVTRVPNDAAVGEIVITLPSAPPELYLHGVEWRRRAVRYAASAATLGRTIEHPRGADAVHDLVLFDGPEQIEAAARKAIEEGRSEVSPTFRLDADLAARAFERGERLWESIIKMLEFGGPQVDPEIESLHDRTRAVTERALAGATGTD